MSPNSSRRVGFQEVQRREDGSTAGRAHRSARLPNFIGMGVVADDVFSDLQLAVVAAGSVGRRIALSAARLHPKTLWIVDRGRYKPESLLTQEILPGDVGDPKATNTGLACKAISPQTQVFVYDGPVQELSRTAFAEAALAVMSPDNLGTEVDVGQRCLHLGIPLVHASLHGESMVAHVRTFENTDGSGPCPACGFSSTEWTHLSEETTFSCGGPNGDSSAKLAVQPKQLKTLPTMSTSFLCGLTANLAMVQITRRLLGLGSPLADTVMQYCGYTHATSVAELQRNRDCHCEHVCWNVETSPLPLEQCTLGMLAAHAGFVTSSADAPLAFEVDEYSFVEAATCCGQTQPVGRFSVDGCELPGCSQCGRPLQSGPFYERRPIPENLIDLDRSLGQLGAGPAEYVIVHGPDRATLYRDIAAAADSGITQE